MRTSLWRPSLNCDLRPGEEPGWIKARRGGEGIQSSKQRKWWVQTQKVRAQSFCGILEVIPEPKKGGRVMLSVGDLLHMPASNFLLDSR